MKDYCVKAYAYSKYVRIFACSSTTLVEEARKLHSTWPTATAALGRFLTASAMFSLMYKANESLSLIINGDGPLGQMVVKASNGIVKGSIQNPNVYLKYNNGHLAVGKAVGENGTLTVIKDLHMKQPFTSVSSLQSGEIGDDFTYYFASSEQIPSSVGLGVLIDTDNSVKASGGFILQIMSGCPDEIITKVEKKLKAIKPISEMIADGLSPEDMIKELSDGDVEILDKQDIKYHCDCSKERFALKLESIGEKELEDIIKTDKKAEVMCHFCMTKYEFSENELKEILSNLRKRKEKAEL